uniref:Uncharacterized protein n=1 Tax=Anguilla anguilla TaxID=7936 RepID=A0A0E9SA87_ANGAN
MWQSWRGSCCTPAPSQRRCRGLCNLTSQE